MARRLTVFAKNISEHNQPTRHHMLKRQVVLPVAPMQDGHGYLEVRGNGFFLWPAGSIIQIPFLVWAIGPGLGKKTWTREVTQADFKEALRGAWLRENAPMPEATEKLDMDEAELGAAPLLVTRPRGRPRKVQ